MKTELLHGGFSQPWVGGNSEYGSSKLSGKDSMKTQEATLVPQQFLPNSPCFFLFGSQ